ncbi:acyl-protein thioesterase 1 homolog 1-like isoform X2 [Hibiscus syriacus]|uniref:acyl-protein thioesterase 1 homolog 1-like isoform X2 n=1 Tax=Hibiscus syriacus TaxID=106335 RepID=UPI00192391BF|nr:acyl-protein thioesterase 1 homolog 1-like isoform X2 [Hibiscus syriacus]
MSYSHNTMGSGSRTARRKFEFGRIHVVRPKGKHHSTIIWLHGLGDNGSTWSELLESLPLPNVKMVCPTAPTRPVALLGGFPYSAWFDVGELSADGPDDWEGLDASAACVANLLSTEPSDVKVGIRGFNMGAAMAFYSATAFALGRYGNGSPYNILYEKKYCTFNKALSFVKKIYCTCSSKVLPCRCVRNKIEVSHEAARHTASLPIMLCHGTCDDVVPYKYGEISAHSLSVAGFWNLSFKNYEGIGHHTVPKEMNEVCNWLTARLGLEGSR